MYANQDICENCKYVKFHYNFVFGYCYKLYEYVKRFDHCSRFEEKTQ